MLHPFHSLSLKFFTHFKPSKSHPSFLHQLKCLPVTEAGNELSLDPELLQHCGGTTHKRPHHSLQLYLIYVLPPLLLGQSFSKNTVVPKDHLPRIIWGCWVDNEAQDPLNRFLCMWGSDVCILKSTSGGLMNSKARESRCRDHRLLEIGAHLMNPRIPLQPWHTILPVDNKWKCFNFLSLLNHD